MDISATTNQVDAKNVPRIAWTVQVPADAMFVMKLLNLMIDKVDVSVFLDTLLTYLAVAITSKFNSRTSSGPRMFLQMWLILQCSSNVLRFSTSIM